MSDYLPPEIVTHILTRLPVASILRCTAVCKSWYSLITSSSFISSHLNLTLCNTQNLLLVRFCDRTNYLNHYQIHPGIQSFDKIEKLECPVNSLKTSFCSGIMGYCNGLYYFSEGDIYYMQRFVLWNPSIRKSLTLPEPKVMGMSNDYSRAVGFGFLPETNEYKIVRAVYFKGSEGWKTSPEVEIYNLSTGNWTDVDARDWSFTLRLHVSQAFLNDSVHWDAYNRDGVGIIVSINLKTEKFSTLMIPDMFPTPNIPESCYSNYQVSTFKDLLCLIPWSLYGVLPIWVMNEYGVESSWVKQYSVDTRQFANLHADCNLFTFRKNSDILLAVEAWAGEPVTKLVSFDPNSKEFTNIGKWEDSRALSVYTYMESLALIKVPNDALSRVVTESDSQSGDGGETED